MTHRRVLIIGTDHRYQIRSSELTAIQHHAFETLLRETAKKYSVKAMAEESNRQALEEADVLETSMQRIARELEITHLFCDPDRKTRAKLGIRQENDIRASCMFEEHDEDTIQAKIDDSLRSREHYWLNQLLAVDKWPILYICGANHARPFSELLATKQVQSDILFHD